jgi:hypothetical protein
VRSAATRRALPEALSIELRSLPFIGMKSVAISVVPFLDSSGAEVDVRRSALRLAGIPAPVVSGAAEQAPGALLTIPGCDGGSGICVVASFPAPGCGLFDPVDDARQEVSASMVRIAAAAAVASAHLVPVPGCVNGRRDHLVASEDSFPVGGPQRDFDACGSFLIRDSAASLPRPALSVR